MPIFSPFFQHGNGQFSLVCFTSLIVLSLLCSEPLGQVKISATSLDLWPALLSHPSQALSDLDFTDMLEPLKAWHQGQWTVGY
jgi:hypothetical protein